MDAFTPSQWTSVIVQFDRVAAERDVNVLPMVDVIKQLVDVGAVVSEDRGEDLVSQALSLGLVKQISTRGKIALNASHPTVERTRLIRDRLAIRVRNTLRVRGWEYVNYGFLLKGLAMDRELELPGMNLSDQWRSHWIDAFVRENVLERELIPHRQNPDDLVPVIKMRDDFESYSDREDSGSMTEDDTIWATMTLQELQLREPETADMIVRVIVSVEQFTSFRGFDWCPLGSLHRRLRDYDTSMAFQRSVEFLMEHGSATVDEYENPQSNFTTKGISINTDNETSSRILGQRDEFIGVLLKLYEENMVISAQNMQMMLNGDDFAFPLWFSIMETENVLNPIPSRNGQYTLFRSHHTVNLVAESR
jgi:hypothetical protein